jgi:hypothetical protein
MAQRSTADRMGTRSKLGLRLGCRRDEWVCEGLREKTGDGPEIGAPPWPDGARCLIRCEHQRNFTPGHRTTWGVGGGLCLKHHGYRRPRARQMASCPNGGSTGLTVTNTNASFP